MIEDKEKLERITMKLKKLKIKFTVINGINIMNNNNYLKYLNRWEYQQELNNNKMSRLIFDHDIYMRKNPDLSGILKNKIKAWAHWNQTGKNEGRKLFEKTKIKNIGQLGCLMAHLNVINDATAKNYKKILVLEDDIYFHNDFNSKFNEYFNNIPNNWHLIYFGGIQKKWDNINVRYNYYNSKETEGAFAYALKDNLFGVIKTICLELVYSYDECLREIQKISNKCYTIYPNLVITDLENSRIHRSRDMKKYGKYFKWELSKYY